MQDVLEVYDLSDRRLHQAAVYKDTAVRELALSPDGHEVGYSLPNGHLYISEVP